LSVSLEAKLPKQKQNFDVDEIILEAGLFAAGPKLINHKNHLRTLQADKSFFE